MTRKIIEYVLDLVHGARQYPCGWLKPHAVFGHFGKDEKGRLQRLFFEALLGQGFRRTPWQLVFPGQTAGLIKRIPADANGIEEYHVRFYNDGTIDCELEVNRFSRGHWAGSRKGGVELLEGLLANTNGLSETLRHGIKKQFGIKFYSDFCIRKSI